MGQLGLNSRLWIDQEPEQVEARITQINDPIQVEALRQLAREGYCLLKSSIPHSAIDAYLAIIHSDNQPFPLKASLGRDIFSFASLDPNQPLVKILDSHFAFAEARALGLAAPIRSLLALIFKEAPVTFQTLYFQVVSL
ncbi:hypothetical protein KQ302_04875 [Synechococcus sp. CS-602]|uniref:hypothetical protein n=1 Tax=Synechococcaceae TaxID=1890426 RepID=UPI0008FF4675|nr:MULTISPECIES: hypothetical protein [Synechococcaceae]MCT4365578.1 hypothetical protein [Candidatus Regnicoccus frigidus MAG-AL1]APD47425.1 hypothetical protein BM449_02855 [Synechococcus sp. SynAce01]MCT0202644.1 hypothetical protein [Synechococcus sp. CS-603]MCT0204448.1 hypothetical protein [Synechococcus sp. CS-602]MCT0247290.1 hypothetical protein [Synechococcus sp. CS-601]